MKNFTSDMQRFYKFLEPVIKSLVKRQNSFSCGKCNKLRSIREKIKILTQWPIRRISRSNMQLTSQPFGCAFVPAVDTLFEAGSEFKSEYIDVGDEVPLGIALVVVAVEAETRGVANRVRHQPGAVI